MKNNLEEKISEKLNKGVRPTEKENEYKPNVKRKMKYTGTEEKKGIIRALNVFLAQNGVKFKALCIREGLDYHREYQKIYVGHIDEADLNRIIKLVDPKASLRKFNDTFVINRSLVK
jgi:hypothetical protein